MSDRGIRLSLRLAIGAALPVALAAVLPVAGAGAQSGGARCAAERGLASRESATPTRLSIVNQASYPVRLFWLDFDGRRRPFALVQPGRTHAQRTFASHPWVIADMAGNCRQVLFAESRDQQYRFDGSGKSPPVPPRPRPRPEPIDGPDTIEPLTEADAGDRRDIAVGQDIVIALPSNASTGFAWNVVFRTNMSVIEDFEEERAPDARIGQGGTSLVTLRILRRGPAEVTVMYVPASRGGRSRKTLVYRFQGI